MLVGSLTYAAPQSLDHAMKQPTGTLVDVFAVVAHVSRVHDDIPFPDLFREIILVDNHRFGVLRLNYGYGEDAYRPQLMDADLNNHFVMGTQLMVDQQSRCLIAGAQSCITFMPHGSSVVASLEGKRYEIREVAEVRDHIKHLVQYRNDEIRTAKTARNIQAEEEIWRWMEVDDVEVDGAVTSKWTAVQPYCNL